MPVAANEFTSALALAANGVSIVTTDGTHGKAGLTVSSMCSVCAEPALILACVNASNEFCGKADANGQFAVNLLSTEHTEISAVFAGLSQDADTDRFLHGQWQTLETGSPVLSNALVSLDCKLVSATTHGTHRIYIGEVLAVISNDAAPLIYTNRQYANAVPLVGG